MISQLEAGILSERTAIGMGLAQAVNRIKDSDAKSKVIILLTDGVNTHGYFKPNTAAELAGALGIRVYTVGIGSMGMAMSPYARRGDGSYVFKMSPVEIDEELLVQMSEQTGGRYYRAKNIGDLKEAFLSIDKLEKTARKIPGSQTYIDRFFVFALAALLCVLVEFFIRQTVLRGLP